MADKTKKIEREERKQKIRERYRTGDKENLVLIPAEIQVKLSEDTEPKRVCAYCRVSTDDPNQTSSYELQKAHYEEMIKEHPNWELVDIYADEGISGTSLAHRDAFNRMIKDCYDGKIDIILTKSISRFARNTVDCIDTVRKLKNSKYRIGVLFETEHIYTLDETSEMILTVLSASAQEESHTKSEIMDTSIEHRFARGLFILKELLGYDIDEDGNLVINEDEALTVRLCYALFIGGYSTQDIANVLMSLHRKTKLGNTKWTASTVLGVLKNEKHYGAVLARKTFTPNFMDHKARRNTGQRNKWYKEDHHEAIVDKTIYDATMRLIESHKYMVKGGKPLPTMRVIKTGVLRGYIPIDLGWRGFTLDQYVEASESAYSKGEELKKIVTGVKKASPALKGFKTANQQMFFSRDTKLMTLRKGKIIFSRACSEKFEDTEYVELLFNPVEHRLAVRPCDASEPNAIHWITSRGGKYKTNTRSCSGLMPLLIELMDWDEENAYKFRAMFNEVGGSKVMIFDLEDPYIECSSENGKSIDWNSAFEDTSVEKKGVVYLDKLPASAEYDIKRRAATVAELNDISQEDIEMLLTEAEEIMERIRSGKNE